MNPGPRPAPPRPPPTDNNRTPLTFVAHVSVSVSVCLGVAVGAVVLCGGRVRGAERPARQPQGPLPHSRHDGPRLRPDRRDHGLPRPPRVCLLAAADGEGGGAADELRVQRGAGAGAQDRGDVPAVLRAALQPDPLRLRDARRDGRAAGGGEPEAGVPGAGGGDPHAPRHPRRQRPQVPLPRPPPLRGHRQGPLPHHRAPAARLRGDARGAALGVRGAEPAADALLHPEDHRALRDDRGPPRPDGRRPELRGQDLLVPHAGAGAGAAEGGGEERGEQGARELHEPQEHRHRPPLRPVRPRQ
eukprot:1198952-Rhodomonas_salina.2